MNSNNLLGRLGYGVFYLVEAAVHRSAQRYEQSEHSVNNAVEIVLFGKTRHANLTRSNSISQDVRNVAEKAETMWFELTGNKEPLTKSQEWALDAYVDQTVAAYQK